MAAPRDDLQYLFVLTYGRSGSTLLQGILNSIPGYLVRGENRQALRHLHAYHRTLNSQRRKHRRWLTNHGIGDQELPPTHAYYGIDRYPAETALTLIRELALATVLRPDPDTRVAGFKEIRWAQPDTPDFVRWLRKVFPGSRFVVNTRDLDAVARSAWWAEKEGAREELRQAEQMLDVLADELGETSFRVRYDDYVADPAALEGLFRWLGEDFRLEEVRRVMSVKHSWPYTTAGTTGASPPT